MAYRFETSEIVLCAECTGSGSIMGKDIGMPHSTIVFRTCDRCEGTGRLVKTTTYAPFGNAG